MANRYNTPAQMELRDYTMDLPFGELVNLGSTMAGRADAARNDLRDTMKEYSEFESLSNIDNEAYYKLTKGRLDPIVNDMVSNPDLIKTAEGRARIQNAINGADYASINKLKSSAKNMASLKSQYDDLAKKGQFNPFWHNTDFSNYNTTDSGVFSEQSATPFQSILDLSSASMDAMKPMMMPKSSDGVWKRQGFTEERIADQAMGIAADLSLSEVGRKHMAEAVARGLTTPEQSQEWLAQQIFDLHKGKIGVVKEDIDPIVEMNMKHDLRMKEFYAQEAHKERMAKAKADAEAKKAAGETPVSEIGLFTSAHNTNIEKYVTQESSPMESRLSSDISMLLTSRGVAPSSIRAVIDSQNMESFGNNVKALMSSGELNEQDANILMSSYIAERKNQVTNKIRLGQYLPSEFDVNIGADRVRDYYGIGLQNKDASAKSKTYTTENGESYVFTPINKAALINGFATDTNDKIVAGYNEKSLQASDIASDNTFFQNVFVKPFKAGYNIKDSEDTIKKRSAVKQDNKMPESTKNDLLNFAISNIPDIQYSTNGGTTWMGEGGQDGYYARGTIAVSKDAWKKSMDEYSKKIGIPNIDGGLLFKLTTGEYGDEYAIAKKNEGKSLRYNAKESDKAESEDLILIPYATKIFDNEYATMKWNNQGMKEDYSTTGTNKNAAYNQELSRKTALSQYVGQIQNTYTK